MNRTSTTFAALLTALKTQLASQSFSSSVVYLSLQPEQVKLPSNMPNVAIICPGEQRLIDPEINLYRGTIDITLYWLNSLDKARLSDIALTDAGVDSFTGLLVNALNLTDLTDVTNNYWITAKPLRLLDVSQPKKQGLWTSTIYTFEISWENSATASQTAGLPITDSTPADILSGVKNTLITQNVFTSKNCFISLDQINRIPANVTHYAMVSPSSINVESSETMTLKTNVYVDLWTYLGLDQAGRNQNQLTDLTYGIYPEIDAINTVLNWYMLPNADASNAIVVRPLLLRSIETPTTDKQWGKTRLVYECEFGYSPTTITTRGFSSAFNFAFH